MMVNGDYQKVGMTEKSNLVGKVYFDFIYLMIHDYIIRGAVEDFFLQFFLVSSKIISLSEHIFTHSSKLVFSGKGLLVILMDDSQPIMAQMGTSIPLLGTWSVSHNTTTGFHVLSLMDYEVFATLPGSRLIKLLDFSLYDFSTGQIPNVLGECKEGFNLLSGMLPYAIYNNDIKRNIINTFQ